MSSGELESRTRSRGAVQHWSRSTFGESTGALVRAVLALRLAKCATVHDEWYEGSSWYIRHDVRTETCGFFAVYE